MVFEVRWTWIQILPLLVSVWPWTNHLTLFYLRFPIWGRGIIKLSLQDSCKDEINSTKCCDRHIVSAQYMLAAIIIRRRIRYCLPCAPMSSLIALQISLNILIVFYLFIWLHRGVCGILVPQPGIKPMLPALEAWSLNHWTSKEVQELCVLNVEYSA